MTTGTTGNDALSNDNSRNEETVNGLAGDDLISVTLPGGSVSNVTVHGDDGFDTLRVTEQFIYGSGYGSGVVGEIRVAKDTWFGGTITYDGIERIEITAGFANGNAPLATGDTIDILHITSSIAGVFASTGGGNDEIYLSGRHVGGTVYLGAGNDIFDASGATLRGYTQFAGAGGDGDDRFTTHADARAYFYGDAGNDVLIGGSLGDYLYGGSGADTMMGGSGADTYHLDDAGDQAIENPGEGLDFVLVDFESYTLNIANIENISGNLATGQSLTGNGGVNVIHGHNGDDVLDGAGGADELNGNAGDDVLIGADGDDLFDGGAGADTLHGGTGDDVYLLYSDWGPSFQDTIVEVGGEGTDEIKTNFESLSLISYASIENLTGIATYGQTLTGNDLGNRVSGGAGNDLIHSLDGNDTVSGGAGADLLSGGAGDDNLDGGRGNDRLDGNADADAMMGGLGHDVYVVDNVGDRVVENGSSGNDTVESAVDFNLPTHVERLVLTGAAGRAGRGNSGDNRITGNSGGNILNGSGGDDFIDGGAGKDRLIGHNGDDVLTGGAGADRFEFTTALASAGVDRILDFSAVDDSIQLSRSVFARTGANGALAASAFHLGEAAADAGDRIVYDQATGRIFYDADGSGTAAAVHFATLTKGTAITHADFVIFG
jgi:Ca2+-binding RTX toxin-like protein